MEKDNIPKGTCEQAKPSNPKNLNDLFIEAMKNAATAKKAAEKEQCDCMECSGNAVRGRVFSGNTTEISMREGTNRNGTPEMQVLFKMGKQFDKDEAQVCRLTLTEPGEVEEFKAAMQELFA